MKKISNYTGMYVTYMYVVHPEILAGVDVIMSSWLYSDCLLLMQETCSKEASSVKWLI